ncbi:MAG: polysaccharide deacetylase family protein [Endomicrobiales bacterium]|jgi:peptidoglycan/xylan/chitin deacetylase (PgdA/CDA1 family)
MFKIDRPLIIYRYEVIVAVIVLLLTGSIAISSKNADQFLQPLPHFPYSIALTFDDGPHPYYTDAILSLLKDNGATATFFVVGSQVVKYPDLLRSLSANKCEVESHTMTHRNLSHLTDSEIKKELESMKYLIKQYAGQNSLFFRPPGGQYNDHVVQVARDMGLTMVLWSVFPRDHEENDSNAIVRRVLEQSRDGGIVLLHSGRRPTLAALPIIIKQLREKGFRFVTVQDIMKDKVKA